MKHNKNKDEFDNNNLNEVNIISDDFDNDNIDDLFYKISKKKITVFQDDLPDRINLNYKTVAVDTETLGLNHERDRLCLIQLTFDSKDCYLIQIKEDSYLKAKNLIKLLESETMFIFHYARFDVGILFKTFGIMPKNIYCTKIASKIARTYTERHGYKTLCSELLGVEVNKKQQSSYWGRENLTEEQKQYAASDVVYLHAIMKKLNSILMRENRFQYAAKTFDVIKLTIELEAAGWQLESLISFM